MEYVPTCPVCQAHGTECPAVEPEYQVPCTRGRHHRGKHWNPSIEMEW